MGDVIDGNEAFSKRVACVVSPNNMQFSSCALFSINNNYSKKIEKERKSPTLAKGLNVHN